MMQLPTKVGPFTLMRRLGSDAVAEAYVAILDEPAGKQVVARRVHPAIVADPVLMSRIRARVMDLMPLRHPAVAGVQGLVEVDGDAYMLEDWVEGIGLDVIIARARERHREGALPHNVFLDLATQVCNALEAMHGRPGVETGADNVLHLGISPQALVVKEDGQLVLCAHGLIGSPTILPQSATSVTQARMEYLSPEQTHPEQQLQPATDVFALGSVLYELLTLKPMFEERSNLQTIHRVRKAEVTTELLEVKDLLPGLDRVLYRALSVNPRHRYQRAFVLREDLRGLMAGFSFADIAADARAALAPYFSPDGWDEMQPLAPHGDGRDVESTAALLGESLDSAIFDAPTAPPGTMQPEIFDAATAPPGTPIPELSDAKTAPPGTPIPDLLDPETAPPGIPMPKLSDAPTAPPGTIVPPELLEELMADDDPSVGQVVASVPDSTTAPMATDGPAAFDPETAPEPGGIRLADVDTAIVPRGEALADLDTAIVHRGAGLADVEMAPIPSEEVDDTPTEERNVPAGALDNDGDTASFLRTVQNMGSGLDAPAPPHPDDVSADDGPQDTMGFLRAAGVGKPLPEPELSEPEAAPIADMAPNPEAIDAPPLSVLDTQERPSPFPEEEEPPEEETQEAPPPEAAPDPEPVDEAAATEEARKLLAPADSLMPPASEPPAKPRELEPTLPMHRPEEVDEDEDEAAGGMPMVPILVVGAIAAVAVVACLGMSGMGTFWSASQMAATDETNAAPAVAPAPDASPKAAAVAPATPAPDEAPKSEPEPTPAEPAPSPDPAPQTAAVPKSRPRPVAPAPAPAPPPSEPTASTYDAVAAADDVTRREQGTSDEAPVGPIDRDALDRLAGPAFSGGLSTADRTALSEVPGSDPLFTRAHTLLYLDAKARGDSSQRDQVLATLMSVPENQYNPALLVEEAWVAIGRRDWATALARSDRAERHWARLPSELIFSRKAMIYEIQAKAHLGSFYASEGDDVGELDRAIKGWHKYKRHAETQARSDLMATADQQLDRLYDIQRRLE